MCVNKINWWNFQRFSHYHSWEFSIHAGKQQLMADIIQEAFIEVNEETTADHPIVYYIWIREIKFFYFDQSF